MNSTKSSTILLYSTFPDKTIAEKAAHDLLEQRLVACVNILPATESLYWWQGKIESAAEIIVIAKTTADQFEAANACILSLHPYECPCIIAFPIIAGHTPFLEWTTQETHVK
jgi:periplasmic divalent cation tolerance protein